MCGGADDGKSKYAQAVQADTFENKFWPYIPYFFLVLPHCVMRNKRNAIANKTKQNKRTGENTVKVEEPPQLATTNGNLFGCLCVIFAFFAFFFHCEIARFLCVFFSYIFCMCCILWGGVVFACCLSFHWHKPHFIFDILTKIKANKKI